MSDASDRLGDIEFRHDCLARTVEQLDQVVVEHSRTLEALERVVGRLEARVRALERQVGDDGPTEPLEEDGAPGEQP